MRTVIAYLLLIWIILGISANILIPPLDLSEALVNMINPFDNIIEFSKLNEEEKEKLVMERYLILSKITSDEEILKERYVIVKAVEKALKEGKLNGKLDLNVEAPKNDYFTEIKRSMININHLAKKIDNFTNKKNGKVYIITEYDLAEVSMYKPKYADENYCVYIKKEYPGLVVMYAPLTNVDTDKIYAIYKEVNKIHKSNGTLKIYITCQSLKTDSVSKRIIILRPGSALNEERLTFL